ncbi:heterokaryon incompatibility protein-domain-containing protein [Durotheca rogersii]|uniref:heterokaryon incompatibility protein-domain-containing protein n=1 Tax=Durotheca rogersii TaxID=419775 RepID=UPI00221E6049|nr:heterokaryon incompatibility protein-domain-containing protein [Durotheca rogersii]KAI5859745.1 heterokaryon incompatibility protein-domain-containing protein [Durotheca rogersii]
MSQALAASLDQSRFPYSAVDALLISWKDSVQAQKNQFKTQLQGLASELLAHNFRVTEYEIESKRPQQRLSERLLLLLKHDKPGTLLIIYYGGHGLNNKDKDCIWLRDDPGPLTESIATIPSVNWSALQSLFLNDCDSHVLFLLDCCFAASSVLSTDAKSTVEAIVAAGFESMAPLQGKDSFTTFLTAALRESRTEGLPVFAGRLCSRVSASLNQTKRISERNGGRRVTPFHISFSNLPDRIVIGVLPDSGDSPNAMEFDSSNALIPPSAEMSDLPERHEGPGQARPDPNASQATLKPSANPALNPLIRTNAPSTSIISRNLARLAQRVPLRMSRLWSINSEEIPGPILKPVKLKGPVYTRTRSFVLRRAVNEELPTPGKLYADTQLRSGEVRVLELLPSQDRDYPIYCSFQVQRLTDATSGSSKPGYKALSGRWDDRYEPSKLFFYSISNELRLLTAPLSLCQALRQIRDPAKPVFLWVELLCIDPRDEEEQNVQAQMIPEIFQGAEEVVIWLGAGDDTSKTAIDFIPRLLDLCQIDTLVKYDMGETPRQWQALVDLLRQPYFSRRWAFLEIILATRATLYCGDQHIEWAEFCDAVVMLGSRFDDVQSLLKRATAANKFNGLALMKQARASQGSTKLVDLRALAAYSVVEVSREFFRRRGDGSTTKCSLETLVSLLPAMKSGHPGAVIFALVPVANDGQAWLQSCAKIDVDAPVEVYQQFVCHCVRSSKSIDIICRPWAPQNDRHSERDNTKHLNKDVPSPFLRRATTTYGTLPKGLRLPSWIRQVQDLPFGDGSKTGRRNGDLLVGLPHRPLYDASKGSNAVPVFGRPSPTGDLELDGSVTVSGFVINSVLEVGFRATGGIIQKEWIDMCGWQEGDYLVPDSLWRTLVADRGPGGTPAPLWYNQACRYWLDSSDGGDITSEMIRDGSHPSMALEYIQRVRSVIWNRTLFVIEDHEGRPLLGLGPSETRLNDQVCILHGCSVPVVLRRGEDCWTLVGECFVYNLMDGEAMGLSQYVEKTQEFLIR